MVLRRGEDRSFGRRDVQALVGVPTKSGRREQRRSMKKKRHTPEEIAAKLRQADDMLARGTLHSEVAKALGVSIMTYHRWRKARAVQAPSPLSMQAQPRSVLAEGDDAHLAALELENARLRRLVTDLLLEKISLEEILGRRRSGTEG
jgi:putative transposase